MRFRSHGLGAAGSHTVHRSRHSLPKPRNGISWNAGWELFGWHGHRGRQKKTLIVRWSCCSVNDLALSRSLSNRWKDGAKDMARIYLSRLNESANKRTRQHNGMPRKFPFTLSRFVSRVSHSLLSYFRPIPSGDKGTEDPAHSMSAASSPTSKSNKFWESLPCHAF